MQCLSDGVLCSGGGWPRVLLGRWSVIGRRGPWTGSFDRRGCAAANGRDRLSDHGSLYWLLVCAVLVANPMPMLVAVAIAITLPIVLSVLKRKLGSVHVRVQPEAILHVPRQQRSQPCAAPFLGHRLDWTRLGWT